MALAVQISPTKEHTLEDALVVAGGQKYMLLIAFSGGFFLFSGLAVILTSSYVISAAECDLNLSPSQKGLLGSACFIGMIFSSHLVGYFADVYGRRRVIMVSSFLSFFLITVASFCPEFYSLLTVWLLNGLLVAGIVSPSYVYVSEFTCFSQRATSLLIASAIASLATTYQPAMAWAMIPLEVDIELVGSLRYRSWRLFVAASALLPLLCGLILLRLPETPKFLITSGRNQEALTVLTQIFTFNTGQDKHQFKVKEIHADPKQDGLLCTSSTSILQFLKLLLRQTRQLFTPPLLLYTILSSLFQFAIVGVYNVVMMWVPDLVNKILNHSTEKTVCQVLMGKSDLLTETLLGNDTGREYWSYDIVQEDNCTSGINSNVFITNISIGLLQFVYFCAATSITKFVGRKGFLVMNISLGAFFCLLLTVLTKPIFIFTSMGLIAVALGAALPVVISLVVDFFPTYIRSMGSSMCMIFGRIGVVLLSQFFGWIQQSHCDVGYYTLAAFLFVISLLSLKIPLKNG